MSKKQKEKKYAAEETLQNLEQAAHQSEHFLEKNSKILGGIFSVIVLGVIGYFLYLNYYKEPRNKEAATEITQADKYFEQDSMQLAVNGSPGTYMGYNEIIDEYSGTNVANLAKYKAGIALYEQGNYEGALEKLRSFDASEKALFTMKNGAIGDALVQLGKKEEAMSAYSTAINSSDLDVLQKIFTQKAAVLALDMSKSAEGLKLVESYLSQHPESKNDAEIAKLKERLTYAAQ